MKRSATTYGDLEAELLAKDCTWTQGEDGAVNWFCPCGRLMAPVPNVPVLPARTVGEVADALRMDRRRGCCE